MEGIGSAPSRLRGERRAGSTSTGSALAGLARAAHSRGSSGGGLATARGHDSAPAAEGLSPQWD